MESTAIRNLPAKQRLKKGPSFENSPSGKPPLSDALDQRMAGPAALSRLKQALATLLDEAGGGNCVGTDLGAGPAQHAARENFFKPPRPFYATPLDRFQESQTPPRNIGLSKGSLIDRAHTHTLTAPLASAQTAIVVHDDHTWHNGRCEPIRNETFEKRSILFKFKKDEDFNRRNTFEYFED
jgi:hypothetical protein